MLAQAGRIASHGPSAGLTSAFKEAHLPHLKFTRNSLSWHWHELNIIGVDLTLGITQRSYLFDSCVHLNGAPLKASTSMALYLFLPLRKCQISKTNSSISFCTWQCKILRIKWWTSSPIVTLHFTAHWQFKELERTTTTPTMKIVFKLNEIQIVPDYIFQRRRFDIIHHRAMARIHSSRHTFILTHTHA